MSASGVVASHQFHGRSAGAAAEIKIPVSRRHSAPLYQSVLLFTQDAIEELGWESEGGAVSGQQAIEKRYKFELGGGMNNHVIKLVQAYPIGSEVCAITKETVAQWTNSAVRIYVRDADTWKIKLAYVISTMTH
jgi:hypothetical protein